MSRMVVALGGNALLRRGEPAEAAIQRARVADAATGLALVAQAHELIVTHGNGPQVGLLSLEADAYTAVAPYPLDILGAESQGMIGYLLVQALGRCVAGREVVTVLTQVVVDEADPAFSHPTKPIGPLYPEADARRLAAEHGWTVAPDGDSFRRVVPSPEPIAIVELEPVRRLLDAGVLVVCAGGGGIPVIRTPSGLQGVEAVVDKDLTAALLAEAVGADLLVIATDVPFVERDRGTPAAAPIESAAPAELRALQFSPGSMAPKVDAACRFVEATGREAVIGSLDDLVALAERRAGTRVAGGNYRRDSPRREPPREDV